MDSDFESSEGSDIEDVRPSTSKKTPSKQGKKIPDSDKRHKRRPRVEIEYETETENTPSKVVSY